MTSVVSLGTTERMIVRTVCNVLREGAGRRKRYSSTVFGAAEIGLRLLETNLFTVNLPRLDERQLNVLPRRQLMTFPAESICFIFSTRRMRVSSFLASEYQTMNSFLWVNDKAFNF